MIFVSSELIWDERRFEGMAEKSILTKRMTGTAVHAAG
jgi:hypothetical protein